MRMTSETLVRRTDQLEDDLFLVRRGVGEVASFRLGGEAEGVAALLLNQALDNGGDVDAVLTLIHLAVGRGDDHQT